MSRTIHISAAFHRLTLLSVLVLLVTACNYPGLQPSASTPQDALFTAAAQTVIAQVTQLPPTAGGLETATAPLLPTDTAAPTTTVEPTATATATPPPTPNNFELVFEDDFNGDVQWYEDSTDTFGFELTGDGYRIYVNFIQGAVVTVRNQDYEDLRVEAQGRLVTGPPDGYFGVTCRQQDPENYYGFVVSPNGSYAILRYLDGELEFLSEGLAPAGLIASDQPVQIAGECLGSRLALFANGQQLAEVEDVSFSQGASGLVVGARSQPGVEALFTNFRVLLPR